MRLNMKVLLTCAAALAAPHLAPSPCLAAPQFHVECDLHGQHGSDPDRLDPKREDELLRHALEDAYPLLPAKLQAIAPQVTVVIDHRHAELTKALVGGWSAEDDPDYRYPDRGFYPQGTIKVSLTEGFLQGLAILQELGRDSTELRAAARNWVSGVIGHELMHAWQFHTGPLRTLARYPEAVVDGLPDRAILEETGKKVQYEHDAFKWERSFEDAAQVRKLAEAVEKFKGAAKYRVAGKDLAPMLRRSLEWHDKGDRFNLGQKVLIEGQYALPSIVLSLHEMNQPGKHGTTEKFCELVRRWDEYLGPGVPDKPKQLLRDLATYIAPVERRFARERDLRLAAAAAEGPGFNTCKLAPQPGVAK